LKSFEFNRIEDLAARRAALEATEPKIWWEHGLYSTLVITDPTIGADIMRSPNFIAPDLRILVREIRRQHPTSLKNLQPALELLPVFLEDENHARIKKILGQFLAAGLRELEPALPSLVRGRLEELPSSGEVDLVETLLAPLTREVFSRLVGRNLTDDVMTLALGRIFDSKHNFTSLRRLDQMLDRVLAFFETTSTSDDDFICRLNCLVFGIDSVMSTLAQNIAIAFDSSRGHEAAQLPGYPIQVMIATTHRHAIAATQIAEHRVQPSDLIRIHLEPFVISSDKALNTAIFGVGRHACIGKQLALSIWKHLADGFNALKLRGTVSDYVCEYSHSFNIVKSLKVSIQP
jgi:hypothetical protein